MKINSTIEPQISADQRRWEKGFPSLADSPARRTHSGHSEPLLACSYRRPSAVSRLNLKNERADSVRWKSQNPNDAIMTTTPNCAARLHLPQKAGASFPHSKRCRAMHKVPDLREAFGVRPACWRFRFMVPMRDSEIVEASHEPPFRFSSHFSSFRFDPRKTYCPF